MQIVVSRCTVRHWEEKRMSEPSEEERKSENYDICPSKNIMMPRVQQRCRKKTKMSKVTRKQI